MKFTTPYGKNVTPDKVNIEYAILSPIIQALGHAEANISARDEYLNF